MAHTVVLVSTMVIARNLDTIQSNTLPSIMGSMNGPHEWAHWQNSWVLIKVMTMNVTGLFKSHWDLRHTIATHNPDILVLTEIKLTKSHSPEPGWNTPWKGSKFGLQTVVRLRVVSYNRSGGTISCVRESIALATHCTSALFSSDGRIASVILRGSASCL